MAEVTLTLRDTPSGGVSVHSSFSPAIGQPCTPAQGAALELISRTRKQWGMGSTPAAALCNCLEPVRQIYSTHCTICRKAVRA